MTSSPITVLFENDNFVVINKPSGLVVHPFDNSTEITLLDHLREISPLVFSCNNTFTLQNKTTIPIGGIVHKLDRDTSGVMVIAKNNRTLKELQEQFLSHTITKTYIALVEGAVEEDAFEINAPLGRNKKDYKQMVNPTNPRGELREAITSVRVLKRNKSATTVKLLPKTGRTHQLRAHMSYIGHPIVGDIAYGSTIASPRILLHAQSLSFVIHGESYTFEAEVPFTFDETK